MSHKTSREHWKLDKNFASTQGRVNIDTLATIIRACGYLEAVEM
jgi:hypothetical protein